jgi:hypothetical protein
VSCRDGFASQLPCSPQSPSPTPAPPHTTQIFTKPSMHTSHDTLQPHKDRPALDQCTQHLPDQGQPALVRWQRTNAHSTHPSTAHAPSKAGPNKQERDRVGRLHVPRNSPERQWYPTLSQHHLYAHRESKKHTAAETRKICCTLCAQMPYKRANACIGLGTALLQGKNTACFLQDHTTSVNKRQRPLSRLTAPSEHLA